MAYSKKTWVDRSTEYPTRRKLTATGTTDVYDISREEGLVAAEGDAFNAAAMNDFENRIETGLGEKATSAQGTTADNALPKAGGTMTGAIIAGGAQDVSTTQVRNIGAGTTDLTAGSSALATGNVYFVYV